MLINDFGNKDELFSLIVSELRGYGIKYRKEKKHKLGQEKPKRRKIFQIPLHLLDLTDVILSNGGITQVPQFVSDACQRILEQITTEGLFRKAGSSVRQKEIRANLESGLPLGESHHVIDVANILKSFFRELPEPLIPQGNIQETLLRCLLCDDDNKIKTLLMTCLLLPPLSLNTLAFFMQFLHTVSLHSDKNKMSIENLAIIFAPGIMPLSEIMGMRLNNHVKVLTMLIANSYNIGILPECIIEKSKLITEHTKQQQQQLLNTEKKKKKRRSGSLTRMFNGLRKIVGALGSTESLDKTTMTPAVSIMENSQQTPCINKSAKKRKVLEAANNSAFSAKKKKDVLSLLPENGSLLPCTPIVVKPVKKSRLSLGRRMITSKHHQQPQQHQPHNDDDDIIVIPPPMERRWSVVGTPWSRKSIINQQLQENDKRKSGSMKAHLSPVVSLPCLNKTIESLLANDKLVNNSNNDSDFVRIPKSEYEDIKERVSAIESRISQEFCHVNKSLLMSASPVSIDMVDMDNSMNGPEKVLNKYEKTLEETESMGSIATQTDQLAKRLSRDLKIRRSADHKIIRSPSARKIGTMRRRSRENTVKLTRNQSWHIIDKNISNGSSNIVLPDLSFYPRVNLKRGRPNTIQTGLKHPPSPVKKMTENNSIETEAEQKSAISISSLLADNGDTDENKLSDENWQCANDFFSKQQIMLNRSATFSTPPPPPSHLILGATSASRRSDSNISNRRRSSLRSAENKPSTPHYVTTITVGEIKTPMLPPTLPPKKTPSSCAKTPMLPPWSNNKMLSINNQSVASSTSGIVNKALLTPLQENLSGRASIARLRCQNAGMVMAKAKLFDGLGNNDVSGEEIIPPNVDRRQSMRFGQHNQHKITNKHLEKTKSNNRNAIKSPKRSTPRRRDINKSPRGITKRQRLRILNNSSLSSTQSASPLSPSIFYKHNGSRHQHNEQKLTSKILFTDENFLNENATLINKKTLNSPLIKKPLLKTPKRCAINRTPTNGNQRLTPLRATTPLGQRFSPRLTIHNQQIKFK